MEHTPATASADGRLVIGTRTHAVASGTVAGNGGVQVAPGRELCIEGSAGRSSGQLLRYLFFPMLPGTTCGTVLADVGTTVNLRADCSPGGVAVGPLVTPSPATPAPSSPSPTVPAPTATTTAAPSEVPLAAASPSGAAPTASPDAMTPASPLLLGIALLVALAVVLTIVVRVGRGGGVV